MSGAVKLSDVIAIPERAGTEDYVLDLTQGVGKGRLQRTIDDYVVTDNIATAFSSALDLIAAALKDRRSRAAFLSGSFGSGKSHFMAVLYALLGQNPQARAIPELASVIAGHDKALQDKNILRLAYHFLEADSVEHAVLGGYLTQITVLHPDAPLPAVHRSEALIEDAERLRSTLGDDAFLAGLNKTGVGPARSSSTGGGAWGSTPGMGEWDAASYDAAREAPATNDDGKVNKERANLVEALVKAYFSAFTRGAEFIDLDTGLAVITDHAKSLGYDAVVMFLDELVLWLAFRVGDADFFGREAQKMTKLVEANNARAIPLISFVARQLDLARYFTERGGAEGAHQESLENAFRHQQGRFATIVLGDDNLPFVAEKRLLKPVDDHAKTVLDKAFRSLDGNEAVWDVLLDGIGDQGHRGSDRAAFRRTYPFSPALVATLRTLASAMQRDRTALKVMQQLLVDQREWLTVDDVIPVGETFDLVVHGSQAVTPDMEGRFRNARDLYDNKLRPLLLREHKLEEDDVDDLPYSHPFRADDRLVKTLVLSAVAPEVPALKELTSGRLAALNHGSIVSPLRGQEPSIVLAKLRRWQQHVPEIHITSDPRNPVIRLKISEVDYESVVQKAKGEDNDGRRQQLIKTFIWEAFDLTEVQEEANGVYRQVKIWRGSRREVELVFGNVRDKAYLAEETFKATPGTWRFVVDYPFDDSQHSVRDDDQRVDDMLARSVFSDTVVWLPHFLSEEKRKDLGRLAILDWLLSGTGDRWTSNSNHLSPTDRVQARSILENQRDSLRENLRRAIQEAYGAAKPTPGVLEIDEGHDRVLRSLNAELSVQPPVGHDLAAAFGNLVNQVYETSYPAHPRFEPGDSEVRVVDLQKVLEAVQEAHQDASGRAFVEPNRREIVGRVANALGVGHMGETHFVFSAERFAWSMKIARWMGAAGMSTTDPVKVGQMRRWIAEEQPRTGLRPEVADLVIGAWATLTGRAWYRYGTPLVPAPKPGAVADDIELRPEPLPSVVDWQKAVDRAAKLVGVAATAYLTGTALNELSAALRDRLDGLAAGARTLPGAVAAAYNKVGISVDDTRPGRYRSAVGVGSLVADVLARNENVGFIESFATCALPGTDEAAARSLTSAANVAQALETFNWARLMPLLDAEKGNDERSASAKAALDRLRAALRADELAQPVAAALRSVENDVFEWLAAAAPAPVPQPPVTSPAQAPAASGRRSVTSVSDIAEVSADLEAFVEVHDGRRVVVEWRVEP